MKFKAPHFLLSAFDPKQFPTLKNDSGNLLPEIAVVGRSNVGKSSLLNVLFQTKQLVKCSSQPGKTQSINFFSLNRELIFVDLPGYGYAKVPLKEKKKWGPLIEHYLKKRTELKLILFLFDIRRLPNTDDLKLMEWFHYYNKPVILVLTKIDKVNQKQRAANSKAILEQLGDTTLPHTFFSSPKKRGRVQLIHLILEALKEA